MIVILRNSVETISGWPFQQFQRLCADFSCRNKVLVLIHERKYTSIILQLLEY